MSNDLNQCQFIGRLGADPKTRFTQGGDAITSFRLAVGWKSKDKEGAEWVPVVAFGKQAELAGQYLKKGSRVFVSGRFKTRKWQDQTGNDRYMTEINLEQLQFLDSKSDSAGQAPRSSQSAAPSGGFDQFSDDIPY